MDRLHAQRGRSKIHALGEKMPAQWVSRVVITSGWEY